MKNRLSVYISGIYAKKNCITHTNPVKGFFSVTENNVTQLFQISFSTYSEWVCRRMFNIKVQRELFIKKKESPQSSKKMN